METTTEIKTCCLCRQDFPIYQSDLDFYEKIFPTFNNLKYQIPTPTLCPECRNKRRWAFRNERSLYRRKDDLTGKELILSYSPDKSYKVYSPTSRRSDQWEAMEYGRAFDFHSDFFQQFDRLLHEVPQL
jgi:hypothetical protein